MLIYMTRVTLRHIPVGAVSSGANSLAFVVSSVGSGDSLAVCLGLCFTAAAGLTGAACAAGADEPQPWCAQRKYAVSFN